jgi:hypothetical protein
MPKCNGPRQTGSLITVQTDFYFSVENSGWGWGYGQNVREIRAPNQPIASRR